MLIRSIGSLVVSADYIVSRALSTNIQAVMVVICFPSLCKELRLCGLMEMNSLMVMTIMTCAFKNYSGAHT